MDRTGCSKIKILRCLNRAKFLAFIVLLLPSRICGVVFKDNIDAGFSASAMSFVDYNGLFLYSLDGKFALGFCTSQQLVTFYLCITHTSSGVIVWTANRDSPISQSDELTFYLDGNVALVHGNSSSVIWSTNTTGSGATKMQMQITGNLVLLDNGNKTVWQSFDYPTDTLLSGQTLKAGMKLISGISNNNFSSGPYSLEMESGDLRLMFMLTYIYWSMQQDSRVITSATGVPSYALLSSTGLSLDTDGSTVVFVFSWANNASLYRAQLQADGNLGVYFYTPNVWTFQLNALTTSCSLPLYCGYNGVCNYDQCSCPTPFQVVNPINITQGCVSPTAPSCTLGSLATVRLVEVGDGLDYFANQYMQPNKTSSLDACLLFCRQDCMCRFVFYHNDSGSCYFYANVGTVQGTSNQGRYLYVKTNESMGSLESAAATAASFGLPTFVLPVIIGSSLAVILVVPTVSVYWILKVWRLNLQADEDYGDEDNVLESIPGLPTRFTFKELQVATNDFSKKLGSGGFGCVYEGVLPDKSKVAVKQLESVGQGKKEFWAEVAIIGQVHHHHLVQLRGFCAEGTHRLLVYEFMPNGSLDKCLFSDGKNSQMLDWETRHKIALGTAQGLAYLHSECREKIIHCDVKPENILLDEKYNAKVSDFGLAKLLTKEQSQVFTTMRGTRGYLAPEWLMNLAISEKSDVYSFGMVFLELISGRKNYEPDEISEKRYFPAYAFRQAEHGSLRELVDAWLQRSAPMEKAIEAVKIALWCIQEETSTRPSMTKVVQMLEGTVKVPDPPLSSLFAVQLHARMVEAVTSTVNSSSTPSEPSISQSLLSAIRLSAAR